MTLTTRGWIVLYALVLTALVALIAGIDAAGWLGPDIPLDEVF